MISAKKRGYNLLDFPIDEYVIHMGRGTSSRYGYGLGLRSIIDFILNKTSRKIKILKQIIN
jgi:hypothetical protein